MPGWPAGFCGRGRLRGSREAEDEDSGRWLRIFGTRSMPRPRKWPGERNNVVGRTRVCFGCRRSLLARRFRLQRGDSYGAFAASAGTAGAEERGTAKGETAADETDRADAVAAMAVGLRRARLRRWSSGAWGRGVERGGGCRETAEKARQGIRIGFRFGRRDRVRAA